MGLLEFLGITSNKKNKESDITLKKGLNTISRIMRLDLPQDIFSNENIVKIRLEHDEDHNFKSFKIEFNYIEVEKIRSLKKIFEEELPDQFKIDTQSDSLEITSTDAKTRAKEDAVATAYAFLNVLRININDRNLYINDRDPYDKTMNIAVIGVGLSGTHTTTKLAEKFEKPLKVTIIKDKESPWGGIAYGQADPNDNTNIPITLMSLNDTDTGKMLNWSQKANRLHWETINPGLADLNWHAMHQKIDYDTYSAPFRLNVGQYLRWELEFQKLYSKNVTIQVVEGKATELGEYKRLQYVKLDSGKRVYFDAAFAAVGYTQARTVDQIENALSEINKTPSAKTLIKNIYAAGAREQINEMMLQDGTAFIIGSGLSGMEAVRKLLDDGKASKIYLYSKNPKLPIPREEVNNDEVVEALNKLEGRYNELEKFYSIFIEFCGGKGLGIIETKRYILDAIDKAPKSQNSSIYNSDSPNPFCRKVKNTNSKDHIKYVEDHIEDLIRSKAGSFRAVSDKKTYELIQEAIKNGKVELVSGDLQKVTPVGLGDFSIKVGSRELPLKANMLIQAIGYENSLERDKSSILPSLFAEKITLTSDYNIVEGPYNVYYTGHLAGADKGYSPITFSAAAIAKKIDIAVGHVVKNLELRQTSPIRKNNYDYEWGLSNEIANTTMSRLGDSISEKVYGGFKDNLGQISFYINSIQEIFAVPLKDASVTLKMKDSNLAEYFCSKILHNIQNISETILSMNESLKRFGADDIVSHIKNNILPDVVSNLNEISSIDSQTFIKQALELTQNLEILDYKDKGQGFKDFNDGEPFGHFNRFYERKVRGDKDFRISDAMLESFVKGETKNKAQHVKDTLSLFGDIRKVDSINIDSVRSYMKRQVEDNIYGIIDNYLSVVGKFAEVMKGKIQDVESLTSGHADKNDALTTISQIIELAQARNGAVKNPEILSEISHGNTNTKEI